MTGNGGPWWRELNRYHWFVFTVAALGWLFDTMDQQLFNLARVPAMRELLAPSPGVAADKAQVDAYGPYATAIFLMGWAIGGLGFGVLGDRIGRAKTMMLTILVYSLFTGLSAFSRTFVDFAIFRFLTGLGVGGEFAVGVALVAEVMPERARPYALGLLQALSAVGNISAALISIALGHLQETGVVGKFELLGVTWTPWRIMFAIGTLPALLALLIRRRLKEPERWQNVAASEQKYRPGSFAELFGDPRWRSRALVGLVLASSGVIGLWGIGFFSIDLNLSVFRKNFEAEEREKGQDLLDREFLARIVHSPKEFSDSSRTIKPTDLLSLEASSKDAEKIYTGILELLDRKEPLSVESVLASVDKNDAKNGVLPQSDADRKRRMDYLADTAQTMTLAEHADRIGKRTGEIGGRLTRWGGLTSVMLNIGAFFGIYVFSRVTQRVGRRPAFAVSFVLAMLSTAYVFWNINRLTDVFWMIPLMGFCQLSLFGGYAIYLPELFPTRLRSTGISFCYNVGRLVAAVGPFTFGYLSGTVFKDSAEPLRLAGVSMCAVFLLGLLALPFAPETKGQPLPE